VLPTEYKECMTQANACLNTSPALIYCNIVDPVENKVEVAPKKNKTEKGNT
jgi:hypothetical protein